MFLGCKILIFAQTELHFTQILPNLLKFLKFIQFYPNWPKLCTNLLKRIC